MNQEAKKIETVLRKQTNWKQLWFYQKTVVLYQLTYVFTRRFLPAYGDRTVDQMVQAARSGKQNIVEGSADLDGDGAEAAQRGTVEHTGAS